MGRAGAAGPDGRLDSVQGLRALAALMVVLLHVEGFLSLQAAASHLPFQRVAAVPLAAGVDLFFVISGFIIVFASERAFGAPGAAVAFLRRRLCRIVPLYWFALALKLALLGWLAARGGAPLPGPGAVAASFAFVPYDALGFGPRFPFPVIDLGWTLNYEMLFYVLFAGVIWMPRAAAGLTAVLVLACGVLLVWLRPPDSVPLWFWFQPIVLEFALGIGLALLVRRGVRLSGAARAGLILLGVGAWVCLDPFWFDPSTGPGYYGWARLFVYGGGAALILAGAVLGRTEFGGALQRLSRLGDSSYALYLLHPFLIRALRPLVQGLAPSEGLLWPLGLAIILVAVAAAHAFHRRVERPVVEWLQRLGADATGRRRSVRVEGVPRADQPSR